MTLRCNDQATRPLHAKKRHSRNPKAAPTHIKTVPSGSVDFCIKGACAVGGTVGAGYENTPESFGALLIPLYDPVVVLERLGNVAGASVVVGAAVVDDEAEVVLDGVLVARVEAEVAEDVFVDVESFRSGKLF